jgi:MFS family permease
VWVDTFGAQRHKTLMLSLLLLAPPLGVVTGYILTAIFIAHLSWQWAFYAQAVLAIGPIAMGILMIKGKYFEIEKALEKKEYIREGEDMEDMLLS